MLLSALANCALGSRHHLSQRHQCHREKPQSCYLVILMLSDFWLWPRSASLPHPSHGASSGAATSPGGLLPFPAVLQQAPLPFHGNPGPWPGQGPGSVTQGWLVPQVTWGGLSVAPILQLPLLYFFFFFFTCFENMPVFSDLPHERSRFNQKHQKAI